MHADSGFAANEEWALGRDAADPLAALRCEFLIPPHAGGEQIYLCGNSLGLQPRETRRAVLDELDDWGEFAAGIPGCLITPWCATIWPS
jgi:kynureninase